MKKVLRNAFSTGLSIFKGAMPDLREQPLDDLPVPNDHHRPASVRLVFLRHVDAMESLRWPAEIASRELMSWKA